ncbi:MAG: tRNA pseudouridine(38-40) synthase TruA [Acidimicrobiales bacterium]
MSERLFQTGGPTARLHRTREQAKSALDPKEAALAGPLRRVMLLVSYDGSAFKGFATQPQPELETVGGSLERALSKMVKAPVTVVCAGRTDAGVHATGQVVHADLPAAVVERWITAAEATDKRELPRLAKSLTSQCGPALVVARALLAASGFDARRSAVARRYRYELLRTTTADPLARHLTWHVPGELDLPAMRIAGDGLLGEHDFAAFCRRPPGLVGPLIRRVTDVAWKRAGCGTRLSFEIEANAFCHQMVRSIVGSLVAVGQGRLTAADVFSILQSAERTRSAQPAPPGGLCLMFVRYPEEMVPGAVLHSC